MYFHDVTGAAGGSKYVEMSTNREVEGWKGLLSFSQGEVNDARLCGQTEKETVSVISG